MGWQAPPPQSARGKAPRGPCQRGLQLLGLGGLSWSPDHRVGRRSSWAEVGEASPQPQGTSTALQAVPMEGPSGLGRGTDQGGGSRERCSWARLSRVPGAALLSDPGIQVPCQAAGGEETPWQPTPDCNTPPPSPVPLSPPPSGPPAPLPAQCPSQPSAPPPAQCPSSTQCPSPAQCSTLPTQCPSPRCLVSWRKLHGLPGSCLLGGQPSVRRHIHSASCGQAPSTALLVGLALGLTLQPTGRPLTRFWIH